MQLLAGKKHGREQAPQLNNKTEAAQSEFKPKQRIISGVSIHHGLAEGVCFIHQESGDIPLMLSDDIDTEQRRFREAVQSLSKKINDLGEGFSKKVSLKADRLVETYQMLLQDKGFLSKINNGIQAGLVAEAAAQQVLNDTRIRIYKSQDFYLKERLWDFEDLINRLIRELLSTNEERLPKNLKGIVLVAKSLGAADFLEYQQRDLRALILEEGMQTAHVSILAKAYGIPVIGKVHEITHRLRSGDRVLVDGQQGQITVNPSSQEEVDFVKKREARDRVQAQASKILKSPALTLDGVHIDLMLNAGIAEELDLLAEANLSGVGLYRTEIPFMMQKELPSVEFQRKLYRDLFVRSGAKPIIIRTLDIGGDKALPYLEQPKEDNPMLGWRAIRISLDRPMILKSQIRAAIRASEGRPLNIMFPMITVLQEFFDAKEIAEFELNREQSMGHVTPLEVKYGIMVEVPTVVSRLSYFLEHVDFLSVGTNDLFQFFFACDRGNPNIADHFDTLSPGFMQILSDILTQANDANIPISVCGEMAGKPLEAMALLGLGYRKLSMSPANIGPVKLMLRSMNLSKTENYLKELMKLKIKSIRNHLLAFSRDHHIRL